jgi:hypothetical protein
MSRNRLLLAVAAAALIAGTGGTLAQQDLKKERSAPSAQSQPSGGAQQNRDLQRGQAGQQTGQQKGGEQRGQAGQQNRRETTGQAPGSERGNQSSEERKTGQPGERKGQNTRERDSTGQNERGQNERNLRGDRERERTTGQAGQGERRETDQLNRNEPRENIQRNRTQTDRDRVQGERGENKTTVEGREGGRSNVNVQLSQEQRTRIHDVIIKERSAPRVANIDFSLNVGVRVPRTIRLVRVPTTIVEIEPAWRGFEYFLVGDEIVIVDPGTLEIVAVIPA